MAGQRIRRWALRGAIVVALLAAWTVDGRLKAGERDGFVPAKVDWVAYAPRFGRVWNGFTRTPAFRAFNKQWPVPYNDAVLHVRLATGIRPTPIRWNTWLGVKAVIFGEENGVGWCVRPGLLARGAHWVNRLASSPVAPGIYRFGPYCYAWREGFLLFSNSQEVVKDALAGTEFHCSEPLESNEFYLAWQQAPQGFVVVSAQGDVPLRGSVETLPQENEEPTSPLPENPFLELRSSHCSTVAAASRLLQKCFGMFPDWSGVDGVVPNADSWVALAEKAGSVEECGLALYEPKTHGSKLPEAALRFRFQGDAPAPPAATEGNPPPVATAGPFWYLSPSQDLLQALTSQAVPASDSDETLIAVLEWNRAGKVLETYFRALLQQDETLREQLEGKGIPAMQAMATLGRLHIEGHRSNDRLAFTGQLVKVPPSQPDTSQ